MVILAGHDQSRAESWDELAALDTPLLYWGQASWEGDGKDPHAGPPVDAWKFRHAFEGTQIFGGTGSGKTSGSGRTIALAFLTARYFGKHPFGGLVLCAKPEEVALWANFNDRLQDSHGGKLGLGYCSLAGRKPENVIVFGVNHRHYRDLGLVPAPEAGFCFDYLGFMSTLGSREDGQDSYTQTLVNLFLTVLEGGAQVSSNADPYWNDAIRQMLTNAIDLIRLAMGTVPGLSISIEEINRIVLSAPHSRAHAYSAEFKRGRCWQLIAAAEQSSHAPPRESHQGEPLGKQSLQRRADLRLTIDYWLRDFAGLTDRVRSVVESSFTAKATAMLRRPMCDLFSASNRGAQPVTPTLTHQGKVVILDLSVKQFGEVGRFAQILFKTVWQRATEHPSRRVHPNPVFLWADESQYFVTSEDALFLQTARSNKVATVYMTQNISNYHVALAGRAGIAATDSLIGNFQTKIFHANGDPVTNEWAERLFAHERATLLGVNWGGSNQGGNVSQAWLPAIPAAEFMRLKKGGRAMSNTVEAYVFVSGHPWLRTPESKSTLKLKQELISRPGVRVCFDQGLRP